MPRIAIRRDHKIKVPLYTEPWGLLSSLPLEGYDGSGRSKRPTTTIDCFLLKSKQRLTMLSIFGWQKRCKEQIVCGLVLQRNRTWTVALSVIVAWRVDPGVYSGIVGGRTFTQ